MHFDVVVAFIVACYLVAVICYKLAIKAEDHKYSPESSEATDARELNTPEETNLVAYVWGSILPETKRQS